MKIELILFIFVLFTFIDSKRRKKKTKTEEKQEDPLDRRPEKVTKELYCDACQAIIKESIKELRGKKKESDVYDIMDNLCNPEKYYTYRKDFPLNQFRPPSPRYERRL
jgi:cytochrome c-type biogenesis protein CcmH/NrfF